MSRRALLALVAASSLLGRCDMIGNALGIESPEKVAAARDAEGKAIGGACRNAARAIEDCFNLNKKADKAAIFAGWREMNDYMRDNKIDPVAPQVTTQVAGAKPAGDDAGADGDGDGAAKPEAAKAATAKPEATAKPAAKAPGAKRAKPQEG